MKKLLCIAVLLTSTVSAFAQLHLRANVGYNLPINSQVIGIQEKAVYDGNGYSGSVESIYGSYGSGLSFHAGVGGTLNGSLGYDVEVGYLLGKKNTIKNTYEETGFYEESEKYESSSRSFQLAPSLTFTAGTGSVQPYTRMGPVIAFTKLKMEGTEYDSYMDMTEVSEYEFTGGISLGFKGVLGVTFNADKNVQFFGEISFVSMSYAPKEGEITGYTVDGEDVLDNIPSDQRKIKFKDKVSYDDDGNVSLRDTYSMGSLGIQVGIRFSLN